MSKLQKFLKEKENQIENLKRKIKEEANLEKKLNLLEMKETLLENKNKIINKIINIMLNLNKEKKEETIISKNKNLLLKRRADEEPKESQNIKYKNFD